MNKSYCRVLLCCRSERALQEVKKCHAHVFYRSRNLPFIGIYVKRKYLNKLRKSENVGSLHIDSKVNFIPNDQKIKARSQITPWNIHRVLGNRTRINNGGNVKIGILDTGLDINNPDLKGNIAGGVNFVNPGRSFQDDEGHGTFVTGIVCARNNNVDMIGVAPRAKIYGIKVLDGTGTGSFIDVVRGIDWAITNHMDILNMSIGATVDFPPLRQAIAKAASRGMLLVAATGNSGNTSGTGDTVDYPARYPRVIGVAALNRSNRRASFSSTGTSVDISGPGENVYSLELGGGLAIGSGTSFSAPHVTGILAIYKTARPGLSSLAMTNLLYRRAKRLSRTKSRLTGYGLVQQ